MYAILKSTLRACLSFKETGDRRIEPVVDTTSPWLFTDPFARAYYSSQQQLDTLSQDIQTYVMQHGRWQPDELAAKRQLERWNTLDVLTPCDAFADLSPHPTIYRANAAGSFASIVEAPFLNRVTMSSSFPCPTAQTHPGIAGPVRTGRFFVTDVMRLCCTAYPFLEKQNGPQGYTPVSAWVLEYSHAR